MKGKKQFIPNNLRKHRRLWGYSQEDIRKLLKLKSASMISRWERGQTMPSGEHMLKLSVLYRTVVNELYFTLSKEYKIALFPIEKEFIKPKKRDESKPSIRGP